MAPREATIHFPLFVTVIARSWQNALTILARVHTDEENTMADTGMRAVLPGFATRLGAQLCLYQIRVLAYSIVPVMDAIMDI